MYELANNLEKVNFVDGLEIGYELSYNLRRHRKSMHREQGCERLEQSAGGCCRSKKFELFQIET
ncbi:hypothetical protein BpHYR1_039407 [Brachionus plicatilis]|uniref:Uncharacterized protein n=1 Tax=Brachionus plicatilis TaxID=10195 RepID=A0A3M7SUP3_BRAPC|nr:hypothetical protein BpHYR1_039407 [Brachionus plicatilis]